MRRSIYSIGLFQTVLLAAAPSLAVKGPCQVGALHDFHATMLRLLGIDHEKLTNCYSGRDFRLAMFTAES